MANSLTGNLFIITAASGAGKTSLVKAILKNNPNITLSISYTTAPLDPERKMVLIIDLLMKQRFSRCKQIMYF